MSSYSVYMNWHACCLKNCLWLTRHAVVIISYSSTFIIICIKWKIWKGKLTKLWRSSQSVTITATQYTVSIKLNLYNSFTIYHQAWLWSSYYTNVLNNNVNHPQISRGKRWVNQGHAISHLPKNVSEQVYNIYLWSDNLRWNVKHDNKLCEFFRNQLYFAWW